MNFHIFTIMSSISSDKLLCLIIELIEPNRSIEFDYRTVKVVLILVMFSAPSVHKQELCSLQ